jgi:hypothetical protein
MKVLLVAFLLLFYLPGNAQALPIPIWFQFDGGSGSWEIDSGAIAGGIIGGIGAIRVGQVESDQASLEFSYGGRDWDMGNTSLYISRVQATEDETRLDSWQFEPMDPDFDWIMRGSWNRLTDEYGGFFLRSGVYADGFEWGYGERPSAPEPTGLALMGVGILVLGLRQRFALI